MEQAPEGLGRAIRVGYGSGATDGDGVEVINCDPDSMIAVVDLTIFEIDLLSKLRDDSALVVRCRSELVHWGYSSICVTADRGISSAPRLAQTPGSIFSSIKWLLSEATLRVPTRS